MKIKETKYSHKVTLVHPTGKTVVRYTNKPEERTVVLLDNGYKPVEGENTLNWIEINPVQESTTEATAETVEA
tara:strand:- start:189 stop:407 length:219 start_codon:yes stop_codon:yes gene_type:complete